MEVLEFLQSIRTPIGSKIAMFFTTCGTELLVIGGVCLLFWCINKKMGYRLGFVYFISGLFIQTLKVLFRVPRPWVRDKNLVPVSEAVNGATGYSFPSGHTQNATSFFGTIAIKVKKPVVRALMIIMIFAVAFSRMYLGVHTPMDVGVSFIVTITLTFAVNLLIDKKIIYRFKQTTIMWVLLLIPFIMLILGTVLVYTGYIDVDNAQDYFKSAGAAIGFVLGWYIESNMIKFETAGRSVVTNIIIYVTGIAGTVLIKSGLKVLLGTSLPANFIRYFIVVMWVVVIFPLIFSTIERKNKFTR